MIKFKKNKTAVLPETETDILATEAIEALDRCENMQMSDESVVEPLSKELVICENLVKIYKSKGIEVLALQGLDLTVDRGEIMAIIGNSGSGKSTLLNMLGGLDTPSAGTLIVNGRELQNLTKKEIRDYKQNTVGFVWQNNARNLVPYLSAIENIELPMILKGDRSKERAEELLEKVGLSHRKNSLLYQLSGGEQQRVAIAIALANNPSLLLADEPTGAVDSKTAAMILDVFNDLSRTLGLTVIIVTHDRMISKHVNRVVSIRDGRTSSEYIRRSYAQDIQKISALPDTQEQHRPDVMMDTVTHDEYAIVDRVGRLQIPKEYLEQLGITGKSKVKVELSDGKIILTPDIRIEG